MLDYEKRRKKKICCSASNTNAVSIIVKCEIKWQTWANERINIRGAILDSSHAQANWKARWIKRLISYDHNSEIASTFSLLHLAVTPKIMRSTKWMRSVQTCCNCMIFNMILALIFRQFDYMRIVQHLPKMCVCLAAAQQHKKKSHLHNMVWTRERRCERWWISESFYQVMGNFPLIIH